MRAFIVVVAVLLSLVTALYGVEMSCSYKRNVVWADYDDSLQEQLTCSQSIASYTWWKRNTASYGGIRSDCVLKSDEWNLVQRCSDSSICSVGVDSSTVSLEYCVTSGAVNPAVAMEGSQYLECFDITVCPLVISVSIPHHTIFSGSQASVYLTLFTDPISRFNPPLFTYRIDDSSPPNTLPVDNTIYHGSFIDHTVAYTFTVPVSIIPGEGTINIIMNTVTMNNSECGNSLTGDYPNKFILGIIEGVSDWPPNMHNPPTSPPSSPPITSSTAAPTERDNTVPTSNPINPSPPLSPSLSPSLISVTPFYSPPSTASPLTENMNAEVKVLVGVGCGVILLLVVMIVILLMWVIRLKSQQMQFKSVTSSSRKSSVTLESPVGDSTDKPCFFSEPHLPAPPPPLTPSPSLPPSSSQHTISPSSHHTISAQHEPSSDSGVMVTASLPPLSSESMSSRPSSDIAVVYSLPFGHEPQKLRIATDRLSEHFQCTVQSSHRLCHSGTATPDHSGTATPYHSGSEGYTPSHTSTQQEWPPYHPHNHHHLQNSNNSPEQYAFVNGHMFKKQSEMVLHLDPKLNSDSVST